MLQQLMERMMDNPIAKRLLSHGVWAMAGKFGTVFLSLLVNSLLARILAPDEVGIYFLLFSVVTFGSYIGMLGLRQTIVKMLAENLDDPHRVKLLVKRILKIALCGAGGFTIVFAIFFQSIAEAVFNINLVMPIVVLVAVWILIDIFQQIISEGFRGFHNIKLASIFGGFLSSLTLVVSLFVIYFLGETRLIVVVALMVVSLLTSVSIASWLFKRQVTRVKKTYSGITLPSVDTISYKGILGVSVPLLIFTITAFFLYQSDLWIVGAFGTEEEVAIYGAAFRLVLIVSMPVVIADMITPPLIAQMNAQNKLKEIEGTLRNVSTIASIPAIAVIVVFIACGQLILGLIFGEFYKSGAVILSILCIGQLFNVIGGSSGSTLMMTGNQKAIMIITLISSFLMIVGSIIAVQKYGPAGVAVVKSAGLLVQNILMIIVTKRKLGIWTHITWITRLSLPNGKESYKVEREAN
ncbi:oligosaccharide flippase family protein [Alkalihalobacillus hwajinpoensis]|uniref:lipopolysaccharide biosynthesis protein n=1 Tax=Guptibacillus hwajinpoensis TaxID=208199 RepID=UPI001883A449|nr:oligosaccharide flippase family protein [Pseudalkalibacillus hwajinpoensis]MBF0705369.1 oligosaccharide flippase family protein [Pseudalkalibacillus hwajinpoensis]